MLDGLDILSSAVALKTAKDQQATKELLEKVLDGQPHGGSGPECPACGERQKGEFRLCWNCKSDLVWVEGHVCEPGGEEELKSRLLTERRREEEKEQRRQQEEEWRRKHEFLEREHEARRHDDQTQTLGIGLFLSGCAVIVVSLGMAVRWSATPAISPPAAATAPVAVPKTIPEPDASKPVDKAVPTPPVLTPPVITPAGKPVQKNPEIREDTAVFEFKLWTWIRHLPLPVLGRNDRHFDRGVSYSERKNWEVAIVYYTEAIRRNPRYAAAWLNRGIAHREKGEIDKAIRDFTAAIRWRPDFADAFYNRGVAHQEQIEYGQADADFAKAEELKAKK